MNDLQLQQACVQIKSQTGEVEGVGFLIDGSGIIITCAHVIRNANSQVGGLVNIRFANTLEDMVAEVIEAGWRDTESDDLAFIKLSTPLPPNAEPLRFLNPECLENNTFITFGFPQLLNEQGDIAINGAWADGKIMGLVHRGHGEKILQLKSQDLDQGFSGSPVLDNKYNLVVGIITEVKRADPYKKLQLLAWATPVSRIIDAYPNIAVGQLAQSRKLSPHFEYPLVRAQHFKGRESYLKTLKKFWNQGNQGVISLIGIGGSGKTAIVRHFLESQKWMKPDLSSQYPDGLFVWSFYDAPNTTDFINRAYHYFSNFLPNPEAKETPISDDVTKANVFLLAEILEKAKGRFLLVLDGLEKMQSEGKHMGVERGRLIDPPLKHLLLRIADGICGETKAIVTSRFPLTDLADFDTEKYRELNVDKLEPLAARDLLRKLGVNGSDGALELLAEEYGFHALTLDLLGRLIAEYYEGDASKALTLTPLMPLGGSSIVEKQAGKLARVLYAYEKNLPLIELSILENLSVFRRPVTSSFMNSFLLQNTGIKALEAFSGLTQLQLRSLLHSLESRRLVIIEKVSGDEWYTTHPAIRDHFYIRLTESADAAQVHDTARSCLATLVNAPGYVKPLEIHAINAIEELIYHTIKVGQTSEAYKIYKERLGYLHLGWDLGDHVRGANITRLFGLENKQIIGDIDQYDVERLTIDAGLYLKNLGLVDQAINHFDEAAQLEEKQGISAKNRALALQNLSAVQVLRGLLPEAEQSARQAINFAEETTDKRLLQDCRVRLGTALALRGQVIEATKVFDTVISLLTRDRKDDFPRDLPGIRLGWLLMRLGKQKEAETVLRETLELSEYFGFKIISARANVLLAELLASSQRISDAELAINSVRAWAAKAYDQEMVANSNIVLAKIALQLNNMPTMGHILRDGLRVSEECGYSILWIDLKLLEATYLKQLGKLDNASVALKQALNGVSKVSMGPSLYGAQMPKCNYLWGEGDILHKLGELSLINGENAAAHEYLSKSFEIRKSLEDIQLTETETLMKSI